MKPSLAQLKRLAESARGDATLGSELRAHVLGHLEGYAVALGLSTHRLAAAFDESPDDETLGARVVASIQFVTTQKTAAARAQRDEEADRAAARVSDSVRFHGDVMALDIEALIEVARGVDRVQFVDPEDNGFTVNARMLRDILALRSDALALISVDGFEVQWGGRGRIRFRDMHFDRHARTRAVFLPGLFKTRTVARTIARGSRAIYRRTGGEVRVWDYDAARKAYRCLTEQLGIERYIPWRELTVIEQPANDVAAVG